MPECPMLELVIRVWSFIRNSGFGIRNLDFMSAPKSQPRRLRRRVAKTLAFALVLIGVGWLTLPWTLAPYIRSKLQNEVSQHLHASLEMGSLRYQFPYGVHMTDVRLISSSKNSD